MNKQQAAIIKWCEEHRSDLVPTIEGLMKHDSSIMLLGIGFEAGRDFQTENPELHSGPADYL